MTGDMTERTDPRQRLTDGESRKSGRCRFCGLKRKRSQMGRCYTIPETGVFRRLTVYWTCVECRRRNDREG